MTKGCASPARLNRRTQPFFGAVDERDSGNAEAEGHSAAQGTRSRSGAAVLEQERWWGSRLARQWVGTVVVGVGCAAAVAGYQRHQGTGPLARQPQAPLDVVEYVGRLAAYGALACATTNLTALYVASALLNSDYDAENAQARKGWATGIAVGALSLVPFSGRALWMKGLHLLHDLPLLTASLVAAGGGTFFYFLTRGVTVSHVTFGLQSITWRTLVNSFTWPTSVRGIRHIWDQVWKLPMVSSSHNHRNERLKNEPRPNMVLYNPTLLAPLESVGRAPGMEEYRAVAALPDTQLFVNGTFCLEPVQSVSTCTMTQRRFDPFHVVKDSKGPLAHVQDPGSGMVCWYSLAPPEFGVENKREFFSASHLGILPEVTEEEGGDLLRFLNAAQPNQSVASLRDAGHSLTEEERFRLCVAEILVPAHYLAEKEARFATEIAQARRLYRSEGVCCLPRLLPPFMLDAFRTYMRRMQEESPEKLSETSSRYLFMWTDEVAMMYNTFFLDLVQRIVEEKLVSTKCISLYYPKGALLDVHMDSLPFVVAMSLSLEWDGLGADAVSPCLSVLTGSLSTPLRDLPFRYGEAKIFAGHRLPHYRDPSPTDAISVSFSWDLAKT